MLAASTELHAAGTICALDAMPSANGNILLVELSAAADGELSVGTHSIRPNESTASTALSVAAHGRLTCEAWHWHAGAAAALRLEGGRTPQATLLLWPGVNPGGTVTPLRPTARLLRPPSPGPDPAGSSSSGTWQWYGNAYTLPGETADGGALPLLRPAAFDATACSAVSVLRQGTALRHDALPLLVDVIGDQPAPFLQPADDFLALWPVSAPGHAGAGAAEATEPKRPKLLDTPPSGSPEMATLPVPADVHAAVLSPCGTAVALLHSNGKLQCGHGHALAHLTPPHIARGVLRLALAPASCWPLTRALTLTGATTTRAHSAASIIRMAFARTAASSAAAHRGALLVALSSLPLGGRARLWPALWAQLDMLQHVLLTAVLTAAPKVQWAVLGERQLPPEGGGVRSVEDVLRSVNMRHLQQPESTCRGLAPAAIRAIHCLAYMLVMLDDAAEDVRDKPEAAAQETADWLVRRRDGSWQTGKCQLKGMSG